MRPLLGTRVLHKLLTTCSFHAEIKDSLDRKTPDIVELHQDMTEGMAEIHHGIVQCMTTTLAELKRANSTVCAPPILIR